MLYILFSVFSFVLNTTILWFISKFFHWISFDSLSALIITGLFITMVFIFVGVIFGLNLVRIPLEIFGFLLASKVISGFHAESIWYLLATYIVLSVLSYFITLILTSLEL